MLLTHSTSLSSSPRHCLYITYILPLLSFAPTLQSFPLSRLKCLSQSVIMYYFILPENLRKPRPCLPSSSRGPSTQKLFGWKLWIFPGNVLNEGTSTLIPQPPWQTKPPRHTQLEVEDALRFCPEQVPELETALCSAGCFVFSLGPFLCALLNQPPLMRVTPYSNSD